MKYVFEDHYPLFKCTASKCPDTCCKGWEIIIDPGTYEKYKNYETEFGKTITENIRIDEDSDAVFIQKNGRCPFLNKNNLCDIIINEGENALCEVCRQHPRFVEEYGGTAEISLSLSCPAVIDILKNKTSLTAYEERETDEIPEYTIGDPLLPALFKLREKMFSVIKENSLENSLSLIYSLSLKFRNLIDADDYSEQNGLAPETGEVKQYDYYKVLSGLEILTDEWRNVLNSDGNAPADIDENDILLKNILSYFVYRYIPKAINDGDIVSKAEFIIFSLNTIIRYAERNKSSLNQKEKIAYTARLYSKEIEHDPENIDNIINSI